MSSISGIQAISIFDREPGSPTEGVVVQKNRIVGNQGEAILQNMVAEEDSMGLELHAGDESMFEFACYDDAGDDQLKAWAGADKEVELVVAGLQENVLWYEPATIQIVKPFGFATKNRNYRRIRISKSGGSHKVWRGVNLLDGAVKVQGFATGWQDSNSNEIADGYTINGTNPQFSCGIQQADYANSGTVGMFIQVPFPVSGINVDFASEIRIQSGSTDVINQIEARNYNGTVLNVKSSDGVVSYSFEKKSLSQITPATIFSLRLFACKRENAGPTPSTQFAKDPVLRVDGKSTYVAY